MSRPPTRASELAARQVEQIVAAAQEAAEQIRADARRELDDLRRQAERDGDEVRDKARHDAEKELNGARKQSILMTQEARRDAEGILAEAGTESAQLREQTERSVQGRVAAAEKAASDVLAEARTLSGGLQQLGRSLESQADRILRDVTAAHRQMQADLRVGGTGEPAPASASTFSSEAPGARPSRSADPASNASSQSRPSSSRSRRVNPFEDLDVPSWER